MRLWSWLKSFWSWLKANPLALAAALGAAVGAFLVWRSKRNQVANLEDALQVEAERRRIAAAEERARLLEKQGYAGEWELKDLKREIAASKRRVAELDQGRDLLGESDEEIAKRFSDAGF